MKQIVLDLESAADEHQRQAIFLAVASASEVLKLSFWLTRECDSQSITYLMVTSDPFNEGPPAVIPVMTIPPNAQIFTAAQVGDFLVEMGKLVNVPLEKQVKQLEVVAFLDGSFVVTGHIPEPV